MSDAQTILKSGEIASRLAAAREQEKSGKSFGAVGMALKEGWNSARDSALSNYARGDVIVEKLARFMDEAIISIVDDALANLGGKAKIAVAATGGYGRAQLAPMSDIDLVILHSGLGDEALKEFVNQVLYPLWDAGLVVGQGVHTPASAVKLAASDMTAMTAYIDARLIAGDQKLFKEFTSKFDALRRRAKTKFIKAKRDELEERHNLSQQSRYLAEPDIKEGKGGLRDIHAMGWICKAMHDRPLGAGRRSVFRPNDAQSLKKAERFLLSLRAHLHDLRGRADERLTFDIQPALAERLGYADRAEISASERMMKHYFVTAVEIGRLTRIFWARIEEENARLLDRAPQALPKILQTDEAGGKVNLRIKNGRLDFASAARARNNPIDLFRYFRAFAKKPDIDFHPDALALISQNAVNITKNVRRDPAVARLFIASLTGAKDPVKLLRVMSETGLLGKFVPSIGQITGRVQYGLYRRFSLDEHIFQSIGILSKIRAGEMKKQHPIATRLLGGDGDRTIYYIAVLLHESGWSLKDQASANVEALVARVAKRLGMNERQTAAIAWCASHPLLMVKIAERRNLAESRAIAAFAEEVIDIDRLNLLLVLTICHLRAVSDEAWDEWTRRQMTALYFGTEAWLKGGEEALNERMRKLSEKDRKAADAALADWPKSERAAFLGRISDASLAMVEPQTLARAAGLARSAGAAGVAASIRDDHIEAIVYAKDRAGLLADLAGAIAGEGGNVRTVHAITLDDGRIIDVFLIAPPEGVVGETFAEIARAIHAALLAAARSAPGEPPTLARRVGDKRGLFKVEPAVRVDETASDNALVVEAEGRDRPGLLYKLATALSGLGVAIRSAHVATYGERAIDAFYLQTEKGEKISDRRTAEAINKKLMAVLAKGKARSKISL